jgi:alanine racemase
MDDAFAPRIAKALANAPPHTTGVLIVCLGAIRRNYDALRARAPSSETAAVVKADAYGLGVEQVFPALERTSCRTAFVATLGEAQKLRALSSGVTIYVLDGLLPGTAPLFAEIEASPVLNSLGEAVEWASFGEARGERFAAAIHACTGMTRLGLPAGDMQELAQSPDLLARLDLHLIMSHLACADEPANAKNDSQRTAFEALTAPFPGVPRSLANSGGVFLGQGFHFDLTRPGIALYGGRASMAGPNPMEPVVSLYGRIVQVRWAEAGETVGYGAAQTLKRRAKIATVAAGYADGFFRGVSASDTRGGPPGYIGEHRLPLLGRVSMDLITFDATNVPGDEARRGGWIELLGDRVTIDDFAAFAGTIGYEVLTSLGRRYHRVYLDK